MYKIKLYILLIVFIEKRQHEKTDQRSARKNIDTRKEL